VTGLGLLLVLGEFCDFLALHQLLVLLKQKLLYHVLVLQYQSFLLYFPLPLFLVNCQLDLLLKGADLSLMSIFEQGQVAFAFGVLVFFPLLNFLPLKFLGLALYLMGLHVVLLAGELLFDFPEVEKLGALLEVFGFLGVDVVFNEHLK
jgi:hypothetical protein